jgi:hypothetical protein
MGSSQGWPSNLLTVSPRSHPIRGTISHAHEMTDLPRLRKRPLEADATSADAADEIDIAGCATIAYSSEDPAHPVEHLLDGHSGPGATCWISARPDAVEHIVVEFDQPQPISRLAYEVEEAVQERTQEVRVDVSEDGGRTYAKSWFRNTPSAPGEPPTSAKNGASTASRLAISVSPSFQTRTAPVRRLSLRSASSLKCPGSKPCSRPAHQRR